MLCWHSGSTWKSHAVQTLRLPSQPHMLLLPSSAHVLLAKTLCSTQHQRTDPGHVQQFCNVNGIDMHSAGADLLTAAISLACQLQPCIQSWRLRPSQSIGCCFSHTAAACGCPGLGACSSSRLWCCQSQLPVVWPWLGPAPGSGRMGCGNSRLGRGMGFLL